MSLGLASLTQLMVESNALQTGMQRVKISQQVCLWISMESHKSQDVPSPGLAFQCAQWGMFHQVALGQGGLHQDLEDDFRSATSKPVNIIRCYC